MTVLYCAFDINGYGQVYAINADGTGVVQLTPTAGETVDYTWATWSPDDTKILAATGARRSGAASWFLR